jgi:hypothetical protein
MDNAFKDGLSGDVMMVTKPFDEEPEIEMENILETVEDAELYQIDVIQEIIQYELNYITDPIPCKAKKKKKAAIIKKFANINKKSVLIKKPHSKRIGNEEGFINFVCIPYDKRLEEYLVQMSCSRPGKLIQSGALISQIYVSDVATVRRKLILKLGTFAVEKFNESTVKCKYKVAKNELSVFKTIIENNTRSN